MKKLYVQTSNTAAFVAALQGLQQRGAGEACLMVVDGEPGLGKTTTIQWWATRHKAVFIRAKQEWTAAWMLRELLRELGKDAEYSFERMYKQSILALSDRSQAAERDGSPFAVIIDEVDYISRRETIMNTLRDLSDMLEIPTILVGMGKVRHHLTRFPQITSRVGQYVEFRQTEIEDTRALITELCDVPVADDLIRFTHDASKGRCREIKESIGAIERMGRRAGGVPLGLADLAGQTLFNDRATGKPVIVRG